MIQEWVTSQIMEDLAQEVENGLIRISGGYETLKECQEEAIAILQRLSILQRLRTGELYIQGKV